MKETESLEQKPQHQDHYHLHRHYLLPETSGSILTNEEISMKECDISVEMEHYFESQRRRRHRRRERFQ